MKWIEVVSTEETYLATLNGIVKVFMPQLKDKMPEEDYRSDD